MARKFGPFDTSVFYEVENRRLQRAFNPQTGFVKTGQGAVTAGTGAQLVIAAYPDGALIDGMYVENPTTETVTLTTNTASTNPRIDRLVMRLDMTAKTIAPFQIVGTPAASPSAPPLVQTANVYDMPLVQYRFPGSASAQNPGSIVDERVTIDTGWQALTPASGVVPFGYGMWVRKVNGIVYISVGCYATSGWTTSQVVLTLPVGYRPSQSVYQSGMQGGTVGTQLNVNTDGTITVTNAFSGTNVGLTFGATFPVG